MFFPFKRINKMEFYMKKFNFLAKYSLEFATYQTTPNININNPDLTTTRNRALVSAFQFT